MAPPNHFQSASSQKIAGKPLTTTGKPKKKQESQGKAKDLQPKDGLKDPCPAALKMSSANGDPRGLLAGFKVEWDFLDPEKLYCPSSSIDMSMQTHLNKMALTKGIVVD